MRKMRGPYKLKLVRNELWSLTYLLRHTTVLQCSVMCTSRVKKPSCTGTVQ